MQLLFFILLWFCMGEIARVKIDADNSIGTLIILYLFSPFVHFAILLWYGLNTYFSKDWKETFNNL